MTVVKKLFTNTVILNQITIVYGDFTGEPVISSTGEVEESRGILVDTPLSVFCLLSHYKADHLATDAVTMLDLEELAYAQLAVWNGVKKNTAP